MSEAGELVSVRSERTCSNKDGSAQEHRRRIPACRRSAGEAHGSNASGSDTMDGGIIVRAFPRTDRLRAASHRWHRLRAFTWDGVYEAWAAV